jgi:hypothetical protein
VSEWLRLAGLFLGCFKNAAAQSVSSAIKVHGPIGCTLIAAIDLALDGFDQVQDDDSPEGLEDDD